MDVMDFSKDVLETSYQTPVLVDFWASWCGPCRILKPTLEAMEQESNAQWKLVKVNTEERPELAQEYSIKGIPAVKLFSEGKVIAEFTGALPKEKIQAFLEEHLPTQGKKEFLTLKKNFQGSEEDIAKLQQFILLHPELDEAKVFLAKNCIFKQPELGSELVQLLKSNPKSQLKYLREIQDLLQILKFYDCKDDGNQIKVGPIIKGAQEELKAGKLEEGLLSLIQATQVNKGFCKDLPRLTTISVFNLLGSQHELTKKHQRKFHLSI